MENRLLFVEPKNSHTGDRFLGSQYTLRHCCLSYRQETGLYTDLDTPPELDCNRVPGKIASLKAFNTPYGHWRDEEIEDGSGKVHTETFTLVFGTELCDSVHSMLLKVSDAIQSTVNATRLWDLNKTIKLKIQSVLDNDGEKYPTELVRVTESQRRIRYSPICVHPPHAYLESLEKRGKSLGTYVAPSQSTIVTGPHGGLHNNTLVEMAFEEKEGAKDLEKRTYDRNALWFFCAGYTPHSQDAGMSRRVSLYTRVRVMSKNTLSSLISSLGVLHKTGKGKWIVYCMGYTSYTSIEGVFELVSTMETDLQEFYKSEFETGEKTKLPGPPTYMIYQKEKILYISITPGCLLRSTPGDSMTDSSMVHFQESNSIVEHLPLPKSGTESLKYLYSASFLMTPYVEHDRPPRTLFAAGQTTQAIFHPWSPATARVSPMHSSKPLVQTEFVKQMVSDQEEFDECIWDIFPGEDMCVCYMNMAENYDDSMIVSSKFSDNGGFSTLSLCTYRVSEDELIPEKGETMCSKKYKWWKNRCTPSCVCKTKSRAKVYSTSGRVPSGRVHEILRTEDGRVSIKILSYSQLLTGDKVSTMHGQKGVVRLVSPENLPLIVMKDGTTLVADIYIAVGSVVTRQTNGQVYESQGGLNAVRSGKIQIASEIKSTDTEECAYIMNGKKGHVIMRELPSGKVEPIRATIGFTRVINQTQMTRERHHLTHKSEGRGSLGTTPGRASGGGVSVSELNFHAMYSSGLYGCAQELYDRGNMCKIPFCTECKRIQPLHSPTTQCKIVNVNMSWDIASYDILSACINSSSNVYEIEHL